MIKYFNNMLNRYDESQVVIQYSNNIFIFCFSVAQLLNEEKKHDYYKYSKKT